MMNNENGWMSGHMNGWMGGGMWGWPVVCLLVVVVLVVAISRKSRK